MRRLLLSLLMVPLSAGRLFIAEVDAVLTFDSGSGPAARGTLKQGPTEWVLDRKQP